jgi:tRNA pseudouridine38-40 synthase
MRVALKIAYDGRAFFGHQRQPDRRTVEGECLAALRGARIVRDPRDAFFRSASRTDRGVSAIGNVVAFDTSFAGQGIVGAFNSRAKDVWAWAIAEVPMSFHPRHAIERWYRYTVLADVSAEAIRQAAILFVGTHDFRAFCAEPVSGPLTIERMDVGQTEDAIVIDVRARSFRRGMVRRMVAAILAVARGIASSSDLRRALDGAKQDFGSVPPEPLVLVDVRYEFPFRIQLKPAVLEAWARRKSEHVLGLRFLSDLRAATNSSSVRTEHPLSRDSEAVFVHDDLGQSSTPGEVEKG